MISAPRGLRWFVDAYVSQRRLRPKSAYQISHSCELLDSSAGHPEDIRAVDEAILNRWLIALESTQSQRSIANHRANVLAVLRLATDMGLHQELVMRRIRRARKPEPCPVAWTADEVSAILTACRQTPGVFLRTGVKRALYLSTLFLAGWDSGLRRSDLWRLRRTQVRADGTIILSQHKTGRPHWPRFRRETMSGWGALPGEIPLACPYACDSDFYRAWRRVIVAAHVRPGCLQQLRRSAATHLATEHPEAVQRFLGHASPEMTRHYVDWSIAKPQQWLPPAIK